MSYQGLPNSFVTYTFSKQKVYGWGIWGWIFSWIFHDQGGGAAFAVISKGGYFIFDVLSGRPKANVLGKRQNFNPGGGIFRGA